MPSFDIVRTHPTPQSFRAAAVCGMFDVPPTAEQTFHMNGDLPHETAPWQIGVIVGASGSGKSTLARHLWPDKLYADIDWRSACLLDDFPQSVSMEEITRVLVSVGLASVPAWLLPYSQLSTGQKFRAQLARALICGGDLLVYDEFTSVVDRTVAAAASYAVGRYIRRMPGKQLVAVSCHRDIVPWLEPDWVYDTDSGTFSRERLRRPGLTIEIHPGDRSVWPMFAPHHYMSRDLSRSARVFLAYVSGWNWGKRLVGFFSLLPVMGHAGWWRGHRTVILPDFQGVGIGNAMIEGVAEWLFQQEGKRFCATTSAPALINHRRRHPEMWRCRHPPLMKPPSGKRKSCITSAGRLTTSWEYVPVVLRRGSAQSTSAP